MPNKKVRATSGRQVNVYSPTITVLSDDCNMKNSWKRIIFRSRNDGNCCDSGGFLTKYLPDEMSYHLQNV